MLVPLRPRQIERDGAGDYGECGQAARPPEQPVHHPDRFRNEQIRDNDHVHVQGVEGDQRQGLSDALIQETVFLAVDHEERSVLLEIEEEGNDVFEALVGRVEVAAEPGDAEDERVRENECPRNEYLKDVHSSSPVKVRSEI